MTRTESASILESFMVKKPRTTQDWVVNEAIRVAVSCLKKHKSWGSKFSPYRLYAPSDRDKEIDRLFEENGYIIMGYAETETITNMLIVPDGVDIEYEYSYKQSQETQISPNMVFAQFLETIHPASPKRAA